MERVESSKKTKTTEEIMLDLSVNECGDSLPKDLTEVVAHLDSASASIRSDVKGASTSFRVAFVSTYMILHHMLRAADKDSRKNTETKKTNDLSEQSTAAETKKPEKLDVASIFDDCTSPTVKAAVALFCLPKSVKRLDRFKVIASILTNSTPVDDSIRNLCLNSSKIPETYKPVKIDWVSPSDTNAATNEDCGSSVVNEHMRLSRAMLQIADFTNDKSMAHFAKHINKHAYYKNVARCARKSSKNDAHSITIFEPLFSAYIRYCVAPINATKQYNRLTQQFEVDPSSVITYMLERLPLSESSRDKITPIKATNDVSGKKQPTLEISESLIPCYSPDRLYDVYIGNANYQQFLELSNTVTPQLISHVATVRHCLYDVYEKQDLTQSGGMAEKVSLMRMPWRDRLNLLNWAFKIKLVQKTGADLLKYANNTDKSQAVTISCINDEGLSVTQTVLVKPQKKKTATKRPRDADENGEHSGEHDLESIEILKKPKIEVTEL